MDDRNDQIINKSAVISVYFLDVHCNRLNVHVHSLKSCLIIRLVPYVYIVLLLRLLNQVAVVKLRETEDVYAMKILNK